MVEQTNVDAYLLDVNGFAYLVECLRGDGFRVIGPTVVDGAIIYQELDGVSQLPVGLRDRQGPGFYRLEKWGGSSFFGFVVGPHSWKKFLFPSRHKLLTIKNGKQTIIHDNSAGKMAFLGVRSCELAAIDVLDRVFLGGPYIDSVYAANRNNVFVIAVNCTEPGENCFCLSMSTGPRAKAGYDISLTEVVKDHVHHFIAYAGTERGRLFLEKAGARPASAEEVAEAEKLMSEALAKFKKSIDTTNLKQLIYSNLESPVFAEVAERCLACGNCTLVCPTCFCNTVEEVTNLSGDNVERWRRWDSCFNLDFSHVFGGSIRVSRMSRYRQWFTHKLATWLDQFGVFGCVGCGRCITWCPVGIDITAEAAKLRQKEVQ